MLDLLVFNITYIIFHRVRDVCEHILLSGECDIARKTEEYLWRKAFYDIIHKLKIDKKVNFTIFFFWQSSFIFQGTDSDSFQQILLFFQSLMTDNSLQSVYASHLQGALGFYHNLLVRLRNRYNIALQGIIDWIGIPLESGKLFRSNYFKIVIPLFILHFVKCLLTKTQNM